MIDTVAWRSWPAGCSSGRPTINARWRSTATSIGLAIAREYGAGTVFYAGQSLIELAGHGTPQRTAARMWLQVRDVYATEKELTGRGVPIAREARQEPWGLHEMHVTDPDGVTLIFVQVPEDHPLRRDTRR